MSDRTAVSRMVAAATLVLLALAPVVRAAEGDIPVRIPGQAVYDLADVLTKETEVSAESLLRAIRGATGSDVVVVTETATEAMTDEAAGSRARALRVGLEVGVETGAGGIVVYVRADRSGCAATVAVDRDATSAGSLPDDAVEGIIANDIEPLVAGCDVDSAVLVGLGRIATALIGGDADDPAADAGPPFPEPIDGVRVYDQAGAFRPETIATVARTIAAIEARTGAEVVVYSQVVGDGRTTEQADGDARALMDQWRVGRKGFDDGLVILFDLYPGLHHGQAILYGGPGYRAAFLDNAEKQRIFDDDMVPRLRAGDMDGALLIAIQRVDANATPEHAATLQRARQIDAVVGLVGAPLALVLLAGSAAWSWLRYGRDPVYLDDPSIHMAGPPAALTPAVAVFVQAGGPSRRALTTALIDLASRGTIVFQQERHLLGLQNKVGIATTPAEPDPVTRANQRRNAARPLGPAEQIVSKRVATLGGQVGGYIEPEGLPALATVVPAFDKALEREAVASGWFAEPPTRVTARWRLRAGIALAIAIVAGVGGANLPSSGSLLIGVGLGVGAIIVFVISGAMPAVTLPGAMIRAMLAAYRRTLKKTMDAARSMDEVVAQSGLAWLETPDQAVVWGTALGLQDEIEAVLGRSLEDAGSGRVAPGGVWLPTWYVSSSGAGSAFASGDFAGATGGSGGLFSSSSIPDFGGMMSALGTIGSAPSSSGGSGGGGGFGGGGSGGGGGGSGGGF